MSLSKMALTEKRPAERTQRGAQTVKAPCAGNGRYHSGAAREDRAGPSRYRGHERREIVLSVIRVEPWDFMSHP